MSPYSCHDWLQTHLLQVTNGKCFILKDATPLSSNKSEKLTCRNSIRVRCPINTKQRPAVPTRWEQGLSIRRDSLLTCLDRGELQLQYLCVKWTASDPRPLNKQKKSRITNYVCNVLTSQSHPRLASDFFGSTESPNQDFAWSLCSAGHIRYHSKPVCNYIVNADELWIF